MTTAIASTVGSSSEVLLLPPSTEWTAHDAVAFWLAQLGFGAQHVAPPWAADFKLPAEEPLAEREAQLRCELAAIEDSLADIGLAAVTAATMPLLAIAKARVARQLGSSATHSEGRQNMLCAYLSLGLLAGLGANALFGWWWADPVAALAIAVVAVREGREAWRGEDSCCAPVGRDAAGDSCVCEPGCAWCD
jgi:hypothetical protein